MVQAERRMPGKNRSAAGLAGLGRRDHSFAKTEERFIDVDEADRCSTGCAAAFAFFATADDAQVGCRLKVTRIVCP
ncbi:hypothetical protein DQ384_29065 [Sphaerisporangium album]|uniref:Uncharacterized protein n=1 Tax=Sphaerisporangium album TaxID=509200 RepID=A0A367F808_9ACTN|nr:hypothetical protein [Sphaerisporangium album]RCG26496.1 hypothetical protein DQ384_29065 [Sphaerisporangium album]